MVYLYATSIGAIMQLICKGVLLKVSAVYWCLDSSVFLQVSVVCLCAYELSFKLVGVLLW